MSTTGQVVADWRIAEQSCRPGYGQAVWQRNMCVVPAREFPGDVGVCQSTALGASNLPASPSDLLPGVEVLLPRCRPARAAVLQLVEVVAARQHTPVRLHTRAEPHCTAGQTTNENRVRWRCCCPAARCCRAGPRRRRPPSPPRSRTPWHERRPVSRATGHSIDLLP